MVLAMRTMPQKPLTKAQKNTEQPKQTNTLGIITPARLLPPTKRFLPNSGSQSSLPNSGFPTFSLHADG